MQLLIQPKLTISILALKKKDGRDLFGFLYYDYCGKNTLFIEEEERSYYEVYAKEIATKEATKEAIKKVDAKKVDTKKIDA